MDFAWTESNPIIPIIVLLAGFMGTLLFEFSLLNGPEKVEKGQLMQDNKTGGLANPKCKLVVRPIITFARKRSDNYGMK